MSFVRPEVARTFVRWGEAIVGAGAFLIGAFLLYSSSGLGWLFGGVLGLGGAALLFTGVRRGLRPLDGGGAGIVEVDERQISYFSATGGGAVSVDELSQIRVQTFGPGKPFIWHLAEASGATLSVPSDAEGAGALFDALFALPGFDASDAFDAGALAEARPFVAWERPPKRVS